MMREVTENEVRLRLRLDNPWWREGKVDEYLAPPIRRAHFEPFFKLVTNREVNRAVVLMGPRRVGKTVLIRQTIDQLIKDGTNPKDTLYLSLDTPVYTGLGLENILRIQWSEDEILDRCPRWVFFDEVQYLRDWERHLKSLVDSLPHIRFVVSGSAAAALRLKSTESGAGRFTDFMLPALAFCEYMNFIGITSIKDIPIDILNKHFFDYINFGGFPEVVLNNEIKGNITRFVKEDILDKVLLRDLPALYGVDNIQELNHLFTVLAYNTSEEVSYDGLSQSSGLAKNTVRKYVEYLEAAFLIIKLPRIDQNAKRFKRETHFKVHLANPSIRAALFGEVKQDDEIAGNLVETAITAQIQHGNNLDGFRYARWQAGEVDLINLNGEVNFRIKRKDDEDETDHEERKPIKIKSINSFEIKWSDRFEERPSELKQIFEFNKKNKCFISTCTTKTKKSYKFVEKGWILFFVPAAGLCYDFSSSATQDPLNSLNSKVIREIIEQSESQGAKE
ncbi:ATP-binding protein [Roseomonas genomospecies 6]|uniref:ATP-binding protein n=1 Tax=Roseomonas genomospecies 6 TaxID=214106 RepID=A0A9W7U0N2_9PROT|nr:ATP-binding protein [Roseomonas genomospecies 6]KAA0683026.1 ATP-binding protein [Roseomonas genomospecies 6]